MTPEDIKRLVQSPMNSYAAIERRITQAIAQARAEALEDADRAISELVETTLSLAMDNRGAEEWARGCLESREVVRALKGTE